MNKYIVLCMSLVFTYQLNSMEIAIDLKPTRICKEGKDSDGKTQLFVPIRMYEKQKLRCGAYIPLEAIEKADNGDTVYDNYDGSGNTYHYICKQSNADSKHTFAQALQILRNKNK